LTIYFCAFLNEGRNLDIYRRLHGKDLFFKKRDTRYNAYRRGTTIIYIYIYIYNVYFLKLIDIGK